jgi:hypothetical protein
VSLSGSKKIVIILWCCKQTIFLFLHHYELSFYTYDELSNVIEVGDMNGDGFVDLVIGRYANISNDIQNDSQQLNDFFKSWRWISV